MSMMSAMAIVMKGEGNMFGRSPKMVVGQSALWVLQTMTLESKIHKLTLAPNL